MREPQSLKSALHNNYYNGFIAIVESSWLEQRLIPELDVPIDNHHHLIVNPLLRFDFALEKYGYTGNLGDKLKQAEKVFSDINGVWLAHKMRNKFAHKINFQPSELEFRTALESFRKALLDLKIKL